MNLKARKKVNICNAKSEFCKKRSSFLEEKSFCRTMLIYDLIFSLQVYPLQASCNLKCIAKNDAEIAEDFGPALDGTECFMFNLNLPGRCVAGKCIVSCKLYFKRFLLSK